VLKPGVTVSAVYPDGREVRATTHSIEIQGLSVDLAKLFPEIDHSVAYAYTEVTSAKEQTAFFFIGREDDGAKVWVNGEPVFETSAPKVYLFLEREKSFGVSLKKGVNRVLVKIPNDVWLWEFGLEVYDKPHADKVKAEMADEAMKIELQTQELSLANSTTGFVFHQGETPRIVWRDADTVRRLAGDLPLSVRWFDSKLTEVVSPTTTGRYAAYIEAKLKDGTPIKRAMTFFCVPQDFDLSIEDWGLHVPYPGKPFDPAVWQKQSSAIDDNAGRVCRDSLVGTQDGAILLAGLMETDPKMGTCGVTESPEVLNDDYELALKLKLGGMTDKVRPLGQPRRRTTPAEVLHEGSAQEAGVKPDAKEKIDAVCREWAEVSGEPFVILVARHGVIVTHAAFGKTPDGKPIGLDYRKDIASVTKTMAGMLFSQFMDQGYVQLDDPIGKVLPDFPTTGDRAITFRMLFTHMTGLDGHGLWGGLHNPFLDNVIRDGLDGLRPGLISNYNGMGYDLAGKAMEMMTGKSIVRLLHENLFRPLNIENIYLCDLGYSAKPTAYELGIMGQWIANHGSYGDKEFISEETFQKYLPTQLGKFYKGADKEWGVGVIYVRDLKSGAKPGSADPKDLIFGSHVLGHGSSSGCILRVDLDKDLVIVQVRRVPGEKFDEYRQKFLTAVSESLQ
jgi:CubicO group peptidase (beta-lactamase class C family)